MSLSVSSGGGGSSLKSAQLRAVYRMLAFNQGNNVTDDGSNDDYKLPPAGSSHNQWKILIYDTACRSIISPLLNVSQLRRRGVTLHLLLNSDREPIPDVPAVYFVSPTKENLAIIAQDCSKRLYGRMHLNFVTKLDRSLMEEFAKLVVQSGSMDMIASVHDQYLDYVCLEKHLFSLHKQNSYVIYNNVTATEQIIESYMTQIAYGLFSVIASLGQIPIIRCPKNGAPEMVARKLNRMISEHPTLLRGGNKSIGSGAGGIGGSSSYYRPLLVILDRNADLITPCQHTSTYQALIDDVLDHKANRVEFDVDLDKSKNESEKSKKPGKKVHKKFDLDPDEDPFYCQHKFQPFPEAIESNGIELQEVTEREQQIRSAGGGGADADPLSGSALATDHLASAVDSLPALLERKKQLEVHTSILQAVMNEVASRDIPQFYELESSLTTGVYKNDLIKAKQEVLELIQDPLKGSLEDKIRLIIVFSLSTKAKTADIDEAIAALMEQQSSISSSATGEQIDNIKKSIDYIKKFRSMNMQTLTMVEQVQGGDVSSGGGGGGEFLSSFIGKATSTLAKATDKVSSMMLGKIHKYHSTVVVENLLDMKPNTEDDEYLYLDPKVKGDVDVTKLKTMTTRSPIKDVVAFIIGGGCYSEYQNMVQMLGANTDSGLDNTDVTSSVGATSGMTGIDRNRGRTITYGSTELVYANEFLSQLGQLG